MKISPMPATPYENARKSLEALSPADQLRLVAELMTRLSTELDQEVWQGIDIGDYLRRERSSWNG